jgi:hypothetical protein
VKNKNYNYWDYRIKNENCNYWDYRIKNESYYIWINEWRIMIIEIYWIEKKDGKYLLKWENI